MQAMRKHQGVAVITIRGIRLDSLSYKRSGDEEKVSGSYSLISSADRVLAQSLLRRRGKGMVQGERQDKNHC